MNSLARSAASGALDEPPLSLYSRLFRAWVRHKPEWLTWLVAGYRLRGDCHHSCHRAGWSMNMETRRGRFTYWLLDLQWYLANRPSSFRFWAADQCARLAMRIRGEKVTVFGFYDARRGNRAAHVCEVIDTKLFDLWLSKHWTKDEYEEVSDYLEELGSIAGAAWQTNWPKRDKS